MKYLFITIILAFSFGESFSQGGSKKSGMACALKFGALAGITSSSIGGESESWKGQLIGGQLGGFLNCDVGIPEHVMYQAEVNVSTQGSKWDAEYIDGKVVTTYINVPVVAQYRKKKLLGEIGVQPGFLISAKDKYGGNSEDYKEHTNSFDFGIPVGVAYYILKNLSINFRYIHGLTNVNKNDPAKDRNRVLALRFLWLFD